MLSLLPGACQRRSRCRVVCSIDGNLEETDMRRVFAVLIPVSLLALAGCVVSPRPGYYYGPRAVVVAPAPAVVIRP